MIESEQIRRIRLQVEIQINNLELLMLDNPRRGERYNETLRLLKSALDNMPRD